VPFVDDVVNDDEHPRDEEIAAFLDNRLSASERSVVALHLASCDECRALLGTAKERPARAPRVRLRWTAAASVVAAAALVLAVSLRSRQQNADVDRMRSPARAPIETSELSASSPRAGAVVSVDTLVLRWASAGEGVTYDLSIVDAAGGLVWSARVDSAGIAPPREVTARLQPGSTYYWRADALLPDLRTASTGPQGFVPASR
jgi:hypothetical protein